MIRKMRKVEATKATVYHDVNNCFNKIPNEENNYLHKDLP
jgi:hypothetical protein